jgi:hypothetical protein
MMGYAEEDLARQMIIRYLAANANASTEVRRLLSLFMEMSSATLTQEHIEWFANAMSLERPVDLLTPITPLDLSDALAELSRSNVLRCVRYKGMIFYELTTKQPSPGAVEVSMRPDPVQASPLYGLVEAASRTLAPTKPEMEAVLATLHSLGVQQRKDPEYLRQLQEALITLEQCADVPSFLNRLLAQGSS